MLVVTLRLFLGAEAAPFAVKHQRMLQLPAVGSDVALTPHPALASRLSRPSKRSGSSTPMRTRSTFVPDRVDTQFPR